MSESDLLLDFKRRLQRLEDIEEIRTLRNNYHRYVNDALYESIGSLFTPDATMQLGYLAQYEGREAIHRGFVDMRQRDRFFIKQFIHGHTIEIDGDKGTGIAYLDARYALQGKSYVVSAKYDDIYVRQSGKWQFQRMACEFYYTVPVSVNWIGDDVHQLHASALKPQ